MYSSQEKSYRDLNQIIVSRQNEHQKKYEKHQNSKDADKPYFATYPTTLDFKDIRGYALIHYAAMIGDVNKIDDCIRGKADVNLDFSDYNLPLAESHKSPLQMALENGHLEAAKKLYEAGANVESIRLHMCGNEACRTWFKNLIAEALSSAYPDPNKIEAGPEQENRFFKQFNYDKTGSIRAVLARAIEIENTDFLEACAIENSNSSSSQFFTAPKAILQDVIKKDNAGVYYPEQAGLLQVAVANKNQKMAKFLISKGAKINPDKSNRTHPLYFAILNNDEAMVDFLLENNADIHYSDRRKYTPLMHAVLQQNAKLVKKLLEKGARVNDLTIDGDNVFHLLAFKNNPEIREILINANDAKEAMNKKNIYGFTPSDIQEKLSNNTMPPTINQTKTAHIMHYYLLSQYRDTKFFPGGPHCNGFAFKFLLSAAFENPDYYFSTMELFSKWDGNANKDSFLFKNFKDNIDIDESLKKTYEKYGFKNLADILEQWITDVAWFQANGNIPNTNGIQSDRETQYTRHANLKKKSINDNQPKILLSECNSDSESFTLIQYSRSYEQHVEILKYLSRMPKGLRIEFYGTEHTTSAILDESGKFKHNDSNHKHETVSASPEDTAQDIINYKYIRLKNAPDYMNCPIQASYAQIDFENIDFNSSIILSDGEIPKSKEEVKLFQKNSPNKFTPLHIAIMTNNISLLKKLLAHPDSYDLNARDIYGRTPLHMAQVCNSEKAIVELLKYENDNVKNLSHVMTEAYKKKQYNIAQHIFDKNIQLDYSFLIELAIKNNDLELVKKIVEHKNVDINLKQEEAPFPLSIAVQDVVFEVAKYLLECGADLFMAEPDTINTQSALERALSGDQYNKKVFNLICAHLKNTKKINDVDHNGFAAIHYAAKNKNFEALRLLLSNGADIYTKDKNNQSVVDYCDGKENADLKKLIQEHIESLSSQSNLRFCGL